MHTQEEKRYLFRSKNLVRISHSKQWVRVERESSARKWIQNDESINYSRLEREEGRGDSDKGNCGAGDTEATGTALLVSGGRGGRGSRRGRGVS